MLSLVLPPHLNISVGYTSLFNPTVVSWCETQYQEVVTSLERSFPNVSHNRFLTRTKDARFLHSSVIVLDSCEEEVFHLIRVPGWFNFTMPFPPIHLSIKDRKTNLFRLKTEEEKEQDRKHLLKHDRSFLEHWEWETQHALTYFSFVPFLYSDQCFQLKRYIGVNIYGLFSVPA